MAGTRTAPVLAATTSNRDNLVRRLKLELAERREAIGILNQVGFTRTLDARYRAAVVIVITGIGFTWAVARGSSEAVVAGGVALGAIFIGAQQFAASRNEVSLDKFYDRLQANNDKLENYPCTREFIGQAFPAVDENEFQRRMYVFRELDSLEYAIAKYRIGFMSPQNAERSLRTFRARCIASEPFACLAHKLVRGVDVSRDPGYDHQTKEVVCEVVRRLGYACSHA